MNGPPQPPGSTEEVVAERVLVLAPHYDDEILGCGGLLLRLLERGASVTVRFLTDGRGGVETVDDRDAYAARRREEAERVAEQLGLAEVRHHPGPDGDLARRLDELAAVLRHDLEESRPDLVLTPSPVELSSDHRATFAALHAVLAGLRDGDPLLPALRETRFLAYEVNRPLVPDLLVRIDDVLERFAAAMELYASQQERHDYRTAALGLRRFRTLTLPPGVTAAEGYRRLALDDFRTRSASWLVRALGGQPEVETVEEGPLVSVVVRTRDRPQLLAEALASLAEGSYRRVEVVLVNDGGTPVDAPSDYPFAIETLSWPESRGRAAAAEAGIAAAHGEWVAFLDDDDLAAPEHLATLVDAAVAAGLDVVYSDAAVGVYELADSGWQCVERRLPYSRDFDPALLLVDNYIPFNTLLMRRELLERVRAEDGSCFDPRLPFLEDWELLLRLARRTAFHHLPRVTCEYRHFRGAAHHVLGGGVAERGDFRARFVEVKARVLEKHADALDPATLARAIDRLRGEAVGLAEELAATRRESARERRERLHLEADHRQLVHGHRELEAETTRLWAQDAELRQGLAERDRQLEERGRELEERARVIDDQSEHLARTYGEIERLEALIRDMEQTRAWRWHRRLERLRGGGR